MTLAAYQNAFARMVLSPAFWQRARCDGEAAFAAFEMDATERARLLHIAHQPGMRITCILARANRLSSLVGALPLTCELIKPQLGALVDRYWDIHPMADLQLLSAGITFAAFLDTEVKEGRVTIPLAADVLRYEQTWLDLQLSVHTGVLPPGDATAVRELAFSYDPTPLFEALNRGKPAPDTLPGAPMVVVLDFRSDPPQTDIRPAKSPGLSNERAIPEPAAPAPEVFSHAPRPAQIDHGVT